MDFLPEEFEEILNIFRGETEEIIQKMNNNLLQLESSPNNKELLVYLFRDAHSLKGAARMIGFNNIQRLAHKAEDVLGLAKENKIDINREISDALYKATDLLSDLIQESVKIKREYYSDDTQKHIDYIDSLINKYQKKDIVGDESEENQSFLSRELKSDKTKDDIKKNSIAINGLISEAYVLLQNLSGEEGSAYLETFEDITKKMTALYNAKNKDYGNSFDQTLNEFGLVAGIVRLNDKLNRIKTLYKQEALVDESIDDTLIDLANYSIMCLLWRHKDD